MDAAAVVGIVLAVVVFGVPFLWARASPYRGIGRGGRPRHPFRLPTRYSRLTGLGDQQPNDHLDLPPVRGHGPE